MNRPISLLPLTGKSFAGGKGFVGRNRFKTTKYAKFLFRVFRVFRGSNIWLRPSGCAVFFSALLLGFCHASQAGGPDALAAAFQQGNAHYQSGDYQAADRCYRLLADQGLDSTIVYYNLGNACFKNKKLGEAIYFWEKARRLAPGDPDVLENLQLANLLVVDRIDIPEDPLPVRMVFRAAHLLTIAQESKIVLALFMVANVLFGAYFLLRSPRLAFAVLAAGLVASFLVLLFAGSLGWKVYEQGHRRDGVIIEQKVEVRSGPGGDNLTVVTVHEGIVVRVRGESNGWYQISLPNGWNGWLPSSALRIL